MIEDSKTFIRPGLFASILVHLAFIYAFLVIKPIHSIPEKITVFLEPAPNFKELLQERKTQIITPPESKPEQPKVETNLRSDQNFKAKTEQIKRGDGLDHGRVIAKTKPANETKKSNSGLILDPDSTALDKIANNKITSSKLTSNTKNVTPFSRPDGQSARFLGYTGSADFLPNIKDGDLTLLNAKADKFAVFVRRVATRVFNQIKHDGWSRISRAEVQNISQFGRVEAIMDLTGKLVSVNLIIPSGSSRFDNLIKDSVRKSASDPHPQKEAQGADGLIHFIFEAKTWSQMGAVAGARDYGVMERRWLVLGTGLG